MARAITAWLDGFLSSPEIEDLCHSIGAQDMGRVRSDIGNAQHELIETLTVSLVHYCRKQFVDDLAFESCHREINPLEVYENFCVFAQQVTQAFHKTYQGSADSQGSIPADCNESLKSTLIAAMVPHPSPSGPRLERPEEKSWEGDWDERIPEWEDRLDGLWEDTLFRCVTDPRVRTYGDVYLLPVWPRLLLALRDECVKKDFLWTVQQRLDLEQLRQPAEVEPLTEPSPKRKRGRPSFPVERKEQALEIYLSGKRNNAAAKALYALPLTTRDQRQSVPTILKRYVSTHPNPSELIDRFPALLTHKTAKGWVEKNTNNS